MPKSPSPQASELRVLALTPASDSSGSGSNIAPAASPFPAFLTNLSNAEPAAGLTTFAGYTSHPPLILKTRYYEASISIWNDELPSPPSEQRASRLQDASPSSEPEPSSVTLSDWQAQMLSNEAHEVRSVIGAIVLILPVTLTMLSSRQHLARTIASWLPYVESTSFLRDAIEDDTGREVSSIVLLQEMTPSSLKASSGHDSESLEALMEKLEDECLTTHGLMGWNFICWDQNNTSSAQSQQLDQKRNEYGERTGYPRVIEVLEGVDWFASSSSHNADSLKINNDIDTFDTISALVNAPQKEQDKSGHIDSIMQDSHELQQEMLGLRMSILSTEDTSLPSDMSTLPIENMTGRTANHDDVWTQLDSHPISMPARSPDGKITDEDGDEDIQVSQLQSIMERAVAIREAASELTGVEKEKFARREVDRIMRELG